MSFPSSPLWQRIDQRANAAVNINAMVAFFRANRNLLIWLGLAGLIAYGYDLFSFALKIDSENHAFNYGPHGQAWVSQGRWGMYLLSWLLLPDVVMPFIPTLLAVTGMVLGTLFFLHSLSDKRGVPDYLAGALVISCPVLYFAIYFTTLGYGIGMAFLCSGLGIYLLGRQAFGCRVGAMLCFTLAFGIYQATLPLMACLFCLQQTSAIVDGRLTHWKNFGTALVIFLIVVGCAVILSVAITKLLLLQMKASFQSDYILGFVNFQNDATYWKNTALITLGQAWKYYTGAAQYYLYDLLLLKILFIGAAIISVIRIYSSSAPLSLRFLGVLLLLAAVMAPIAMHMMNGGDMPPRSTLGVSFVIAGVVYFAARSSSFVIRALVTLLALSCFYNFSMINNRYAFASEMTWQADQTLSTWLLNDIQEASNSLPTKTDPWAKLPFEIVGWHEYVESPIFVRREVIGSSFYTWGAGDAERLAKVFTAMGVYDYRNATPDEQLSVVEAAQAMPFWPYHGSVAVVNSVIVVKLSEYNPHQLIRICQPPRDKDPVCLKYKPSL